MNDTFSGSVVILHDLYDPSIEAGLMAIDSLKELGYAFVTIPELYGDLEPGVIYRFGSETPRNLSRPNKAWPRPDIY